jgi:hypothetical protein
MEQIINQLQNIKYTPPKDTVYRKIVSIKARHKPVSRKIKYLSYDKEGKFVEKRGSFLDKNKERAIKEHHIKQQNKYGSGLLKVIAEQNELDDLIRLLPKSLSKKGDTKVCKKGTILNIKTNRCQKIKTCKSGFELDGKTNKCKKIKVCKAGFELNKETNKCKKVN